MIRLRSGSGAICETFPPVCSICSSPTQRSRGHIQHFWRAGCCSHKGTGWLTAGSGPSAHPQYLKRFWCSVALGAHDTQKLPQENTSAESWTDAWREVPEGLQEAAAESTWGQGDTEGLRGAQSSSGLQRCHVFTCHSPNIHHTTLNISVPAAELEQSQLPKSLASAGWLCPWHLQDGCAWASVHKLPPVQPHRAVPASPTLSGTSQGSAVQGCSCCSSSVLCIPSSCN